MVDNYLLPLHRIIPCIEQVKRLQQRRRRRVRGSNEEEWILLLLVHFFFKAKVDVSFFLSSTVAVHLLRIEFIAQDENVFWCANPCCEYQ